MFIAPSLLYLRDEQADTSKGGKSASRGANKQHEKPTAHLSANKSLLQKRLPR